MTCPAGPPVPRVPSLRMLNPVNWRRRTRTADGCGGEGGRLDGALAVAVAVAVASPVIPTPARCSCSKLCVRRTRCTSCANSSSVGSTWLALLARADRRRRRSGRLDDASPLPVPDTSSTSSATRGVGCGCWGWDNAEDRRVDGWLPVVEVAVE